MLPVCIRRHVESSATMTLLHSLSGSAPNLQDIHVTKQLFEAKCGGGGGAFSGKNEDRGYESVMNPTRIISSVIMNIVIVSYSC